MCSRHITFRSMFSKAILKICNCTICNVHSLSYNHKIRITCHLVGYLISPPPLNVQSLEKSLCKLASEASNTHVCSASVIVSHFIVFLCLFRNNSYVSWHYMLQSRQPADWTQPLALMMPRSGLRKIDR